VHGCRWATPGTQEVAGSDRDGQMEARPHARGHEPARDSRTTRSAREPSPTSPGTECLRPFARTRETRKGGPRPRRRCEKTTAMRCRRAAEYDGRSLERGHRRTSPTGSRWVRVQEKTRRRPSTIAAGARQGAPSRMIEDSSSRRKRRRRTRPGSSGACHAL